MKKPRTDDGARSPPVASNRLPAPPTTRLGALPSHLSEIVLHFAIGETTLNPGFRTFEPFQSFACVCKEWFVLLDEAVSKRAMDCTFHDFHKPTRQRVLELRRKLILRRAFTERIVVDRAPDFGDLTEQFWLATLSHAPRLEKLDLDSNKKYCLPAHRLADVIKAASTQCLHVKDLVISPTIPLSRPHERQRFPVKDRMAVLARALADAMPRWSKHDGLRVLHLDMSRFLADFRHCGEYFHAITAHAPKLAALDGTETIQMEGKISEQWWLSLEMWDKFCRECKALEMLHWMPVPFATAYFEMFGRYQHEQLDYLVFAAHEEWNWQGFLNAADSATRKAVETHGFREHAVNPQAALRGCPNLTTLEIQWYCHEDEAPMEEGSMDPSVFNDEFFEAAVMHCKKLESVTVKFVGSTLPETLMTLTDRALRALAGLPHLRSVVLHHANVQGHGIFDLFSNHKASTRARRHFKFTLGQRELADGGETAVPGPFYDTLKSFLQGLVDQNDPLPCLDRDVVVTLTNYQVSKVEADWSADYRHEIRVLVAAAQAKYPSLLLRGSLLTNEPTSDSFLAIKEFSIATKSFTADDMWSKPQPVAAVPTLDGIFTNGSMRPSGPRFIEEDDDENFDDEDDEIVFGDELDDDEINEHDDEDDDFPTDDSEDDDDDGDDRLFGGHFDDYEEDSEGYDD